MGLYSWERDRNRILNRLSLALKGPKQSESWRYFAERFLQEWMKYEVIEKNSIIVPCPAMEGKLDHAFLFARSISTITGIKLMPILERIDAKEQKQLTRVDRTRSSRAKYQIRLEYNEKFSQIKAKTVYFVDDIVTTGSTIHAVEVLLKPIGRVKAIALIIRE